MSFRNLICLIVVLAITGVSTAADIANFDDLSLEPNSYWNGSDGSGGFVSRNQSGSLPSSPPNFLAKASPFSIE